METVEGFGRASKSLTVRLLLLVRLLSAVVTLLWDFLAGTSARAIAAFHVFRLAVCQLLFLLRQIVDLNFALPFIRHLFLLMTHGNAPSCHVEVTRIILRFCRRRKTTTWALVGEPSLAKDAVPSIRRSPDKKC